MVRKEPLLSRKTYQRRPNKEGDGFRTLNHHRANRSERSESEDDKRVDQGGILTPKTTNDQYSALRLFLNRKFVADRKRTKQAVLANEKKGRQNIKYENQISRTKNTRGRGETGRLGRSEKKNPEERTIQLKKNSKIQGNYLMNFVWTIDTINPQKSARSEPRIRKSLA